MLEQRDKELAAIGASIGANCRPCIEHHLAAARRAALSEDELMGAVATATGIREEAVQALSARIDELIGRDLVPTEPSPQAAPSRAREVVALGASVGANAHALLREHISSALETGLTPAQVQVAVKMAEHVQRRAGEMTAEEAARVFGDLWTDESPAMESMRE